MADSSSSARRRRPKAAEPPSTEQPRLDRAARRARDRRRAALAPKQAWWRGPWLIVAIVGVLAVVVAGFLIAGRNGSSEPAASSAETAQVVEAVTHVPAATFDAVGTGGLNNPLKPAQLAALTGPNGRPEVLYIGAEYCPYCASERWSLIAALSRFGSFSGLELT